MSSSANSAVTVDIVVVPQRRAHTVATRTLSLPLAVRVVCTAYVVAGVKSEPLGCDVPVAEDKEGSEHWLGAEIEDSVENSFTVGSDHIATLTQAPCNRIQTPEPKRPGAAEDEGLADVGTEEARVLAAFPEEDVTDV